MDKASGTTTFWFLKPFLLPSSFFLAICLRRRRRRRIKKERIFNSAVRLDTIGVDQGRGIVMSSPSKRREMDLMKLMMGDYKVEMPNDKMQVFFVDFHGPKESLYQGGVWRVRVELPDAYPYKSPSIGFVNKMYHPNVDEMSDLVNVFEVFLPQLLLYPNPSDPLNGEAAALMLHDQSAYEQKVKEYCRLFAKPEDVGNSPEDESSDEEMIENEYDSSDEQMLGKPDP
ncbi:hypothetical protein ZIOFF_032409 [Zingiber officinale]|uniref:UBC core domain-containing protein n=1 Tax=Zingiber officinale TaxID=94328 RepID=A0A8J5GVE4_ZINOF|nr:hypothetical protein ZIOFF_032409 [Zingiber officinale]